MAVFKVPRISTANRLQIVLQKAELVFDTDNNTYYGGDDITLGGIPIGSSSGSNTIAIDTIILNESNISTKRAALSKTIFNEASSDLVVEGFPQVYGDDYIISDSIIQWNGLGLDGILEVGDRLVISYDTAENGIGANLIRDRIVLTQTDVTLKRVVLSEVPSNPLLLKALPLGGIYLNYGVDFDLQENVLSWSNLLLDNVGLEAGDILLITYY